VGHVAALKSISLTCFPPRSEVRSAAKNNIELEATAINVTNKTCEIIVHFMTRFPLNFIWLIKEEASWPTALWTVRISTSTFQSCDKKQSRKAQSKAQLLVQLSPLQQSEPFTVRLTAGSSHFENTCYTFKAVSPR